MFMASDGSTFPGPLPGINSFRHSRGLPGRNLQARGLLPKSESQSSSISLGGRWVLAFVGAEIRCVLVYKALETVLACAKGALTIYVSWSPGERFMELVLRRISRFLGYSGGCSRCSHFSCLLSSEDDLLLRPILGTIAFLRHCNNLGSSVRCYLTMGLASSSGPLANCFEMPSIKGGTSPVRFSLVMLLILFALFGLYCVYLLYCRMSNPVGSNGFQQEYQSLQPHGRPLPDRTQRLYCETCYTSKDVDSDGWCHKCERKESLQV